MSDSRQILTQVYSIRIPVSRLGKIRRLAARHKMPPTSMLRQWILERLDLEERSGGSGGEIMPPSSQQATSVLYIHHSSVFAALDPDVIERELRAGGIRTRMASS